VTPEQRRARGIAARLLAEDPTINDAWDELENELRAKWEASWLPRTRDRLWSELRHVRNLRAKLATYAAHAPRD
jgi:hypothetical protein